MRRRSFVTNKNFVYRAAVLNAVICVAFVAAFNTLIVSYSIGNSMLLSLFITVIITVIMMPVIARFAAILCNTEEHDFDVDS